MNSQVTRTIDTNYKNGFVECESCGWHNDLGDGFNQHFIDVCPACSKEVSTRIQTVVTTGKRGNYKIEHGHFVYFAISNGINLQFSGTVYGTEYKRRIPD